ncbi:MAG: nuclear transport factor 2 family protein [bacterium]|nr:nuclear transport factor 2 family protein [bacterium]
MIDRSLAENILKTYGEAWVGQDTNKILSIFHTDGIYHERVLGKPMIGHTEIAQYWQTKVVAEQSDIKFQLLNYYLSENTVIAEWEAFFNSNIENCRVHIKEVAILEIEGDKIKSLREYWQSEKLPLG